MPSLPKRSKHRLCRSEASTVFWSNVRLAVDVDEERRDLVDNRITVEQFSLLRYLQVPLHTLDSPYSTSWLAAVTLNLEMLIISPCVIYARDGLRIDDGKDYDSYYQLICYHAESDQSTSMSFGNPKGSEWQSWIRDREKEAEKALFNVYKKG